MRALARIVLPLAWMLTWLSASGARAAERDVELRLELSVADDQAPTHLCVVTRTTPSLAEGTRAKAHDLSSLTNLCTAEGKCGDERPPGWQGHELHLFRSQGLPRAPTLEGLYEENNEHQCDYGGTGCTPSFSLRGVQDHAPAAERARTQEGPHMTCVVSTTHASPTDGQLPGRGLVLSLETQHHGAHGPFLRNLRLDGRQVSITIKSVEGIGHVTRVLGGFYAPIGEVQLAVGQAHELRIEPRCQWTTIGIPPVASRLEEGDAGRSKTKPADRPPEVVIELELQDESDAARSARAPKAAATEEPKAPRGHQHCWSGSLQSTSLRLLIPYEPRGKKVLSIRPVQDPEQARWELQANWYGPRPVHEGAREPRTGRVNASVRKLSFSWRADPCLYPAGACPVAKISTSDLRCESDELLNEKTRTCSYTCSADGGQLDFPTTITFSRLKTPVSSAKAQAKEDFQRWTVPIHTVGQTLEGYVEPDERAFPVRLELDNPFQRPFRATRPLPSEHERLRAAVCPGGPSRDDVDAIEFSTGAGAPRRVELHRIACEQNRDAMVVKLPRVSCREPIEYTFVGDRAYEPRFVEVENGVLVLPHPMESARRLHYAVALYPVSFQRVAHPSALRYDRVSWAPVVEASLVFKGVRDGMRGWRFNLDATFMGAQQPFLPIGDAPRRSAPTPEGRWYARWLAGFSFLSRWLRVSSREEEHALGVAPAFGAGVQLGIGHPFFKRDFEVLDHRTRPFLALRADARLRLGRYFELVLSPRMLVGDGSVRYSTDFGGQPRREAVGRAMVVGFVPVVGVAAIW